MQAPATVVVSSLLRLEVPFHCGSSRKTLEGDDRGASGVSPKRKAHSLKTLKVGRVGVGGLKGRCYRMSSLAKNGA